MRPFLSPDKPSPLSTLTLCACCYAGGMLAALALAPLFVLPAAVGLASGLYFAALPGTALRSAVCLFMTSWGYLTASLYWIGHSLLIEGGWTLLLLPVVVFGLPAFLALFWAVAGYGISFLFSRFDTRLIALSVGLGCADIVRSVVLTGFPWNVSGQLFMATELSSHMASFAGQHALNIVAMMTIGAVVMVACVRIRGALFLFLPALILLVAAGVRFHQIPDEQISASENTAPTAIRIIQPAIPQAHKWDRKQRALHVAQITELGLSSVPVPELVVLPESAIAGYWPYDDELAASLSSALTPFDGQLLSGILRFEPTAGDRRAFYNSAFLFSHAGQPLATYDKQHLVPFGEYVPFRAIPFIDVIAGPRDFSFGRHNQPLMRLSDGTSLRVLICYEAIFQDFITDTTQRPDILVNITNDGWFGMTSGPYQHLTQARMRALEEGLPLIRAANTGISAAFDGWGRMHGQIGLAERGLLDISVSALVSAPSFYAQNRLFVLTLVFIWSVGGLLFLELRRQKRNN